MRARLYVRRFLPRNPKNTKNRAEPQNINSTNLTCILYVQKRKPRLEKHIKTCYNKKNKTNRKIKSRKLKEKEKKCLKLIPQRKALQALFLTIHVSRIYSQFNKKVIGKD